MANCLENWLAGYLAGWLCDCDWLPGYLEHLAGWVAGYLIG